MSQYKNQAGSSTTVMLYRKTGAEWGVYGDLCNRLLHFDDAQDAYKLCLEQKLDTRSLLRLFYLSSQQGQISSCLSYAAKIVSLLDRTFIEHTVILD